MSVITEADRKLEEAREHITEAYKCLRLFLDPDTWGTDEYLEEKKDEIEKVAFKLLKLKRKI